MTVIKQQLHCMYIGLVFTYWSGNNVKMGTAKQKALQQMQSFSQTIDKKNPVAQNITNQVNEMSRTVSKQIMTDASSEMVLDRKQAQQYKSFGERQVAASNKALQDIIKQGNQITTTEQIKKAKEKSQEQDMLNKQKAVQYRQTKTNVAEKGPKPLMSMEKLNQQKILQILTQQHWQNAA
jgi:hypothetical protein